jgi:predicted ATPase
MMLKGCLLALTGESTTAIDMITSGIAASRLSGSNLLRMPWYLSCLARAHVGLGQLDEANRWIGEAIAAMTMTGEAWQHPDLLRMSGDFALLAPEPDVPTALARYDRALAVAREQRARAWELRAATSLARLWRDRDERQKALDLLTPIYGWFADGFDTPDLKQAKALLAELASQS